MYEPIEIKIIEVIGSPYCVASGDGQKLYERLKRALKENKSVTISFKNIKIVTTAFLNVAIGQLYGEFEEEKIKELITFKEIDDNDLIRIKEVVENAKLFFEDPEKFKDAWNSALDNIGDKNEENN